MTDSASDGLLAGLEWPPTWEEVVPGRSHQNELDRLVRDAIDRWSEKRQAFAAFAATESNTELHKRIAWTEGMLTNEFLDLFSKFRYEPAAQPPYMGAGEQVKSALSRYRNFLADATSAMEKEQHSQFFDAMQQVATELTSATTPLREIESLIFRREFRDLLDGRLQDLAGAEPAALERAVEAIQDSQQVAEGAAAATVEVQQGIEGLLTKLESRVEAMESRTRRASAESLGGFFDSEATDAVHQRWIWMAGLVIAIVGAMLSALFFDDLPTSLTDLFSDHRVPLQLVMIVGWFVIVRTCAHEVGRSGTIRADSRRRAASLRTYSQMEKLSPEDARQLLPALAEHTFRGNDGREGGVSVSSSPVVAEALTLLNRPQSHS